MIGRLWIAGLLVALAAVWVAGQDDSSPSSAMPAAATLDANGFPTTTSEPASEPTTEPDDANEALTQPASGPFGASLPASGPAGRTRPSRRSSDYDRSRFGRGSDRSRSGGAAPSATVGPAAGGPTGTSLEDYNVLVSRNIFVKDRRVRGSFDANFLPPPPPPPPPAEGFILTGIGLLDSSLQQASQRAAFFEDTGAGRLVRVTAGQVFEGGQIASVSLDSVVYDKGGVRRVIGIGGGLAGGGRLDLSTRPAVSEGGAAGGASGGGGDAEERMRRRRLEQIK